MTRSLALRAAIPDVVLGQGTFDRGIENDANQDGTPDALPSANTFESPRGLLVLDDALVVTDGGNLRFLVFR